MSEQDIVKRLLTLLRRSDWKTAANRSCMDGLLRELDLRLSKAATQQAQVPTISEHLIEELWQSAHGQFMYEDGDEAAKAYNERVFKKKVRAVMFAAAPQPKREEGHD